MPLANSIRSFNANTVIEVRTSVISKVSSKGKTTLTAKERFLAEVICRTITRFFFKKKSCLFSHYWCHKRDEVKQTHARACFNVFIVSSVLSNEPVFTDGYFERLETADNYCFVLNCITYQSDIKTMSALFSREKIEGGALLCNAPIRHDNECSSQ